MIGLGVGIDYSLFVVTRHRENLAVGMEVEAAVGRSGADRRAGRGLRGHHRRDRDCGLLISGIPYVAVLGFAAAIVVVVMMVAAYHVAPCVAAGSSARASPAAAGRRRAPAVRSSGSGGRRSSRRDPWPFAIVAVLVLLTLAAPFLSIRYGQSDDGTAPVGSTQRTAFDLIADGFGEGANGPLAIVVTYPKGGSVPPGLLTALKATPGVAAGRAAGDEPRRRHRRHHGGADDRRGRSGDRRPRVRRCRADVVPQAIAGASNVDAYVGGITAA